VIIGHLGPTAFLILNELNTEKFSHFSDCVEKLDIKCGGGGGGGGAEKNSTAT